MSSKITFEQVRSRFIDYFKKQGHTEVASSRTIPDDDPTLLFTNAGMNQFKNVFLGLEKRDYSRAVTTQKCVRAGGKHNDLDSVGHTARHHTFFEMLGNFSFGDYFKKEAIHFAWEFITKDLGLDKNRLYVSVFQDDDEAADIWHKQEGLPKDRIYRFGEKDNFWRMGDSGPCGPCSEIFYDLGPEVPGDPRENVMGGSGDRFIEIWNNVFMQFHEDGKGGRNPLPKPSVDTGMGLERLTAVMQGELSNYHTDLFLRLMSSAETVAKKKYFKSLSGLKGKDLDAQARTNVALRVLADHARATSFLIADGVLPSNEGRGYVLRRIMRRAIRFGRTLSEEQSLLRPVAAEVIASMGGFFGELTDRSPLILKSIEDEEKRFLQALDQGTSLLNDELKKLRDRGQKTLDGNFAFKLYDTYGFPLDLTQLMAKEESVAVDLAGFEKKMEQSKVVARQSWKGKSLNQDQQFLIKWTQDLKSKLGPTEFTGYSSLSEQSPIAGLSDGQKEVKSLGGSSAGSGLVVTKKTSFYAESGGQVGDHGRIKTATGELVVTDVKKISEIFVHMIEVVDGTVEVNQLADLTVDRALRQSTANNHSATHLLHAALRSVLGTHVTQAGSLVEADRLRFDFTHGGGLSDGELNQIESLVNGQIALGAPVRVEVMAQKAAIAQGALAMFGEKYGDEVRVLTMGDFSKELCGGTHVRSLSEIRAFKIVSEGGVSSGVRRIEALTGERALEYLNRLANESLQLRKQLGAVESYSTLLASEESELLKRIEKLKEESKDLERKLRSSMKASVDVNRLVSEASNLEIKGTALQVLGAQVDLEDRQALSDLADQLRDKMKNGVVVLFGSGQPTFPVLVSVHKGIVNVVNAGQILKKISGEIGGKGGGRPDFAQGAGSERASLANVLSQLKSNPLKYVQ